MKEFYSIDDLAAMTRLSTRTIRNYISLGLLDGEKIDGVWQFTAEQFSAFLRQDMVRQRVKAKSHAILYDFLLQDKKGEHCACAVLDLSAADSAGEAALRDKLMEAVNRLGLACSYHYDRPAARVILRGAPGAVAELLALFA